MAIRLKLSLAWHKSWWSCRLRRQERPESLSRTSLATRRALGTSKSVRFWTCGRVVLSASLTRKQREYAINPQRRPPTQKCNHSIQLNEFISRAVFLLISSLRTGRGPLTSLLLCAQEMGNLYENCTYQLLQQPLKKNASDKRFYLKLSPTPIYF